MEKPIYAIGYARVSTPKQATEGDSLDIQEEEIRRYCKEKGYTLFPNNKVFREPYSGKGTSRPEYNEIIEILKKNPNKASFFVIRLISRMTRGQIEGYYGMKKQLREFGVQLRDVTNIIQPETNSFEKYGLSYDWSNESPSETSELMEVKRAQIDRKKVLLQLIEPEIKLTLAGYHVGPADDGYLSVKTQVEMKKRFILTPDPERGKYYIEMFKLRAENIHSDKEIVDRINSMGYRTRDQFRWNKDKTVIIGKRKGIPLTVKAFQRIIQRPCYCGVICEKWTQYRPVRAKWQGLVSIDTFNKANRGKVFIEESEDGSLQIFHNMEKGFKERRNKFRNDFPYKNVVLCPDCSKPLLASYSTGKYKKKFGAYHCTRGHKRYAVSKDVLEKAYGEYLQKIRFTDKFLSRLEKTLILKYRKEEGSVTEKATLLGRNVIDLKEQKQIKLRAIEATTSAIVKADLEKEYEELHEQILNMQETRNKLEITEDEIHSFIRYAKALVEHPVEILANPINMREQLALYSVFFERFPTYDEIANGTPKLSLVFRLSEENSRDKSQMVSLQQIEPFDSLPGKVIFNVFMIAQRPFSSVGKK